MKGLRPEACDFETVAPLPHIAVPPSRAACQHLARPYVDTDRCSVPPLSSRQQTSPIVQGPIATGGGGGGGGSPVSIAAPCAGSAASATFNWGPGAGQSRIGEAFGGLLGAPIALTEIRVNLFDFSASATGSVVCEIRSGSLTGPLVATSSSRSLAGVNGLTAFTFASPLLGTALQYFWIIDGLGTLTPGGLQMQVRGIAAGGGCQMFSWTDFLSIWGGTSHHAQFEIWGLP